jgi:hypothetical protein
MTWKERDEFIKKNWQNWKGKNNYIVKDLHKKIRFSIYEKKNSRITKS